MGGGGAFGASYYLVSETIHIFQHVPEIIILHRGLGNSAIVEIKNKLLLQNE